MLVKMLDTRRGSPDGFSVVRYVKDCVYDIPHSLAVAFLQSGYAENMDKRTADEKLAEFMADLAELRERRAGVIFNPATKGAL